jgi:hypothetical protein
MTEDIFIEKLTWFKQNEKPEVVLLVADNPDRIKIIVAWTNLNVQHDRKLTDLKDVSGNEVWEWLWENVKYSKKELIEKSGVPLSEPGLENKMKPLIGNQIIYPDGTVNSFIQRYLREQVVKLFESKSKKTVKKS